MSLSLKSNPEIKRIDFELAEKQALASEIQLPENPEIEVEARVPDKKAANLKINPAYEIKLTQPLRLSHLGMRQTYAAALKSTANLEKQAQLIRALNETTLLYYQLWILQKREAILKSSQKDAEEVVKRIAEAIEKKGDSLYRRKSF